MDHVSPKLIFIVDDDVALSDSLSDYLTSTVAHKVKVFPTGEDCLKHLEESPDVVILDYLLNRVDEDEENGMEVLHSIKKDNPNIRIIMLSSQEHYLVALQTIQNGADEYVMKDEDAFEKIAVIVNSYWFFS